MEGVKVILGSGRFFWGFSLSRELHMSGKSVSQSFTQRGTMGRLVQLFCRQDTEREETQLGLPKWWVASWNRS